jgi:hypothetical protein
MRAQSLVHSACDISQELYDYAQWLVEERLLTTPRARDKDFVFDQPALQIQHPMAFDNYNGSNKCQGFGLKVLSAVKQGETICKVKTSLGLVSDSLADTIGVKEIDEAEPELYAALVAHTR